MKNHKYPFEYIVEGLSTQERKMLTPFYFNFFHYLPSFPLSESASLVRDNIYKGKEQLPFCIDVSIIGDCLQSIVASNGTYSPAAIEQMSILYQFLLRVICSKEDLTLNQLKKLIENDSEESTAVHPK